MRHRIRPLAGLPLLLLLASLPAPAQEIAPPAERSWVVAEEGNEARYRVREQLARLEFPNDAVGRTGAVRGRIVLRADGTPDPARSLVVVEPATLATDSDRRDNFIRRNTLQTDRHPLVTFRPTAFRGLPTPLPAGGEVDFRVVGELTIREVTRPVLWEVRASFDGGAVVGRAETRFTFGEFGLEIPRVSSVLSVRDEIRLEYDFRLVPEGAGR